MEIFIRGDRCLTSTTVSILIGCQLVSKKELLINNNFSNGHILIISKDLRKKIIQVSAGLSSSDTIPLENIIYYAYTRDHETNYSS